MTHDVKLEPIEFDAVVRDGKRVVTCLQSDGNFALGDMVCLMEFSPEALRYTGRAATAPILEINRAADGVGATLAIGDLLK
jgi:hypothetical protein